MQKKFTWLTIESDRSSRKTLSVPKDDWGALSLPISASKWMHREFTCFTNINSKRIADLNVECKTVKGHQKHREAQWWVPSPGAGSWTRIVARHPSDTSGSRSGKEGSEGKRGCWVANEGKHHWAGKRETLDKPTRTGGVAGDSGWNMFRWHKGPHVAHSSVFCPFFQRYPSSINAVFITNIQVVFKFTHFTKEHYYFC